MIDEVNRMDGRKFDLKTTSTSRVEPLEKGLGEAGQVKHEVFFLSPVHLVACDTAHLVPATKFIRDGLTKNGSGVISK